MSHSIALTPPLLQTLDLGPAEAVLAPLIEAQGGEPSLRIRFEIDYPREPSDPRELSEIPEVRLWFIRLDSRYPWLPYYLDWESGELARYTAMLVPHQFGPDGIRYNPEGLEIFVMQKIFVLSQWLRDGQGLARGDHRNFEGRSKLKLMLKTLGYELDDGLFELLA
ncbi:MAG: CRR6 family NdhI maturation factor [Cyanobacteria bacterium P01_G01_bin.38]